MGARLRCLVVGVVGVVGVIAASAAPAFGQTWVPTSGGTYSWNDPNNWSPAGVPLTGTANVNIDIAGDQTITLDSSPSLTALNIGDLTVTPTPGGVFNSFTIAAGSGGPLQFTAGSTLASQNSANVISAPITLTGDLTVTHAISGVANPTPSQQVGSLTLSGTINLGGNTLVIGQTSSSLGRLDRGVVISGVITGSGGLTKSGGGFLVLSGANNYTGPTTISAGAVRLSGSGAIGNANLSLSNGGQFFPGTATFTRSLNTTGNDTVQIANTAGFGAIDQDLTINFGGSATPDTIVWGATGFTPTQFGLSSTSSNRTITVVNPINFNGAAREVRVDSGTAEVDAVFSGVLEGAASGTNGFTKSGDGTLELTGANTYTGITRLGSNGALRVSNATGLGATGAGNHTLLLGMGRTNRVELANNVTVAEAFQIEGRTATTNLSPALSSFSGANTLTGNITFNASGVEYGLHSNTGATFTIAGNITSTLGTGTNTRNLNLLGGGTGTITGVISNGPTNDPIAVIKRDAGTWTLGGASPHTYTGATTVLAGTLQVNGTLATATAGVTVGTGGTLAGTGTINRAVTVDAGGAVRGGVAGGTGTLTVNNNLTVNSTSTQNGTLRAEVNRTGVDAADAGRVQLTGASSILNLNPGSGNMFTIDLANGISPVQFGETYTITLASVATAGNIQKNGTAWDPTTNSFVYGTDYVLTSSSFAEFDNVSLVVGGGGTDLVLTFTPVPEPGLVLLAGAAGLALVRRVTRRSTCPATPAG